MPRSNSTMLHAEIRTVLQSAVWPGTSEGTPEKQHLIDDAASNATAESVRVFLRVHEHHSGHLPEGHYRTRHAGRTKTEGIGIIYYNRPVNRPRKTEIRSILLPTKPRWPGYIELYLRGHDSCPIDARDVEELDALIAGKPVFHVIHRPSPLFIDQFIDQVDRSFTTSSIYLDM